MARFVSRVCWSLRVHKKVGGRILDVHALGGLVSTNGSVLRLGGCCRSAVELRRATKPEFTCSYPKKKYRQNQTCNKVRVYLFKSPERSIVKTRRATRARVCLFMSPKRSIVTIRRATKARVYLSICPKRSISKARVYLSMSPKISIVELRSASQAKVYLSVSQRRSLSTCYVRRATQISIG